MGRCRKETDRDVGWGDTGWSCWMETLNWEVGQGEVQLCWMEMSGGESFELMHWMVTLDGEVLEVLDGIDGDVGWGDDGW